MTADLTTDQIREIVREELRAAFTKVFVDSPEGVDDFSQSSRQVSDRLIELIGRTGVPVGAGESGEVVDELSAVAHIGRHVDSAQFGDQVVGFAHDASPSVGADTPNVGDGAAQVG
jgi:hypothetical protein